MEYHLPPGTKLVFLVGCPRSGTTWLQLLLSASPAIASSVETHLFQNYLRSLFPAWYTLASARQVGIWDLLTEDEYFKLVREFASGILAHVLAAKPAATIILEKTPNHVLYWREILKIFPDAYFIHLIRDPRSVVASWRALSRTDGGQMLSPMVSDACKSWVTCVSTGREIPSGTQNYLEIQYRDLKQDGVRTLRSVFAFCGVEYSDAEAAEILGEYEIDRLRNADAPGLASEINRLARKDGGGTWSGFRKGEIEGWRSDLTWREVFLVEHIAGKLMDELGYVRAATTQGGRPSVKGLTAVASAGLYDNIPWRLQERWRRYKRRVY